MKHKETCLFGGTVTAGEHRGLIDIYLVTGFLDPESDLVLRKDSIAIFPDKSMGEKEFLFCLLRSDEGQ